LHEFRLGGQSCDEFFENKRRPTGGAAEHPMVCDLLHIAWSAPELHSGAGLKD
jgi:hypothetical protein